MIEIIDETYELFLICEEGFEDYIKQQLYAQMMGWA